MPFAVRGGRSRRWSRSAPSCALRRGVVGEVWEVGRGFLAGGGGESAGAESEEEGGGGWEVRLLIVCCWGCRQWVLVL